MKKLIVFSLKFYKRNVSPILESVFGRGCRFTPTCSEYTLSSVEKFGASRGLMLGLKRIGKCHPFGPYGFDPVPGKI